jgi:hypothetical protein
VCGPVVAISEPSFPPRLGGTRLVPTLELQMFIAQGASPSAADAWAAERRWFFVIARRISKPAFGLEDGDGA